MADFQPPPTYAEVILTDPTTGKGSFNPIWLNWFITLAQSLSGGGMDHENLSGLLGGGPNDHYHLTQAQNLAATGGPAVPVTTIVTPASGGVWQNTTGYNVLVVSAGGAGVNFDLSRDNVTFYPVGAVLLVPVVRGDYLRVTYAAAPVLDYFAM